MEPLVCLASRSPRRRALLQQIGVPHSLVDVAVDEIHRPGESPESLVVRLALEKAQAGWDALPGSHKLPVLAADTMVVIDNEVLGKPTGRTEALAMMARLSARTHQVLTGVALIGDRPYTRLNVSDVTFRQVTAAEAEAYWQSGEPADKAGAYGIQGLGAVFISELRGSYSGVMGLPLFETTELLRYVGIILP